MSDLVPDFEDRETTAALLLLADILARRGERSPLTRVFVPRPRRSRQILSADRDASPPEEAEETT